MARSRRAASKQAESSPDGSDTFTCPECGKTFGRAASLGAHRSRAHGVVGASARRRKRSGSSNGGTTRRRGRMQARRQQNTRAHANTSGRERGRVDRDALLQALFPNGVPAREEVMRRANAWLDEAESLAGAK